LDQAGKKDGVDQNGKLNSKEDLLLVKCKELKVSFKGFKQRLLTVFHEASTQLATPVHSKAASFIFQYSVTFEQGIDCGGGYIKLLGEKYNQTTFGGDTPFLIMFGPDICGNDNKIRFILDRNETSYSWKKYYKAPNDKSTPLLYFGFASNEIYEVYIDAKLLEKGVVSEDWGWIIPKEIADPNDKKPEVKPWNIN